MMKTMKFIGLFLVLMCLGIHNMSGQSPQFRPEGRKRITHEQLSKMKADRLAEELALDDQTAAKFKETYIQYMNEINQLWKKQFPKKPDFDQEGQPEKKERKILSDDEVEKMIKGRFEQSRKMLDIREKYYDIFRKFLSPKQIQKVYDNDMKDTNRFHNEMNRRTGMQPPQGRPHPHKQQK